MIPRILPSIQTLEHIRLFWYWNFVTAKHTIFMLNSCLNSISSFFGICMVCLSVSIYLPVVDGGRIELCIYVVNWIRIVSWIADRLGSNKHPLVLNWIVFSIFLSPYCSHRILCNVFYKYIMYVGKREIQFSWAHSAIEIFYRLEE